MVSDVWGNGPSIKAGVMPAVKKLSVPFSSLFTILNIKFLKKLLKNIFNAFTL